MKKLVIIGANDFQNQLILKAKELGYETHAFAWEDGAVGKDTADYFYPVSITEKEEILAKCREIEPCGVCSIGSDLASITVNYVAEKLTLPCNQTKYTSIQTNKYKMREALQSAGLPCPKFIIADESFDIKKVSDFSFPIIVKPVDLTGGKGIHRAANADEARVAYKDACSRTRQDHIVVEEFVQGSNHGFSAMLVKGKVAFAFSDNEQYYINKYMVSGANSPSTSNNKTLSMLREYSERIAQELHLVDGILHIQYIERADGTPVIIEICRRPPGDLYIKFVKYATGIDYPKFIVLAETGEDISGIADVPTQGFWLRHCIMADCQAGDTLVTSDASPASDKQCQGIVRDVTFAPEIQGNIVEKFLWYKPGEVITDKLTYKAGIVFFKFDSYSSSSTPSPICKTKPRE